MSRIGIFVYGILSYALSLGVFLYAFCFIGGFFIPTILDGTPDTSVGTALLIDRAARAVRRAAQRHGASRLQALVDSHRA